MTKEQKKSKIDYVKPEVLDLGPVTQLANGAANCANPGNSATISCSGVGNSAASCNTGNGG